MDRLQIWLLILSKFVCVFVLRSLIFPCRGGRTSSACKTDQTDFIDQVPFLAPNLMEEISLNTEAFNPNT